MMLALFARLQSRGREPSTPQKILLGMGVMAVANLVMVWACLGGGNRDANIMSPGWLIGTYLVVTLAEILISPMGQSFVTKVAPARFQGLMMGGWFRGDGTGQLWFGSGGQMVRFHAPPQLFPVLTALIGLAVLLLLAI